MWGKLQKLRSLPRGISPSSWCRNVSWVIFVISCGMWAACGASSDVAHIICFAVCDRHQLPSWYVAGAGSFSAASCINRERFTVCRTDEDGVSDLRSYWCKERSGASAGWLEVKIGHLLPEKDSKRPIDVFRSYPATFTGISAAQFRRQSVQHNHKLRSQAPRRCLRWPMQSTARRYNLYRTVGYLCCCDGH